MIKKFKANNIIKQLWMLLKLLKLIGYALFLMQFAVIMAYQYFKYLKRWVISILWRH
jgi:hypothetical protein